MAIEKVNQISNSATSNAVSNNTAVNKNLQTQLMVKQQNLKQLSTDAQLSVEEKEKQRRELQKEIEELKRKLEQMKQRAEKQEAKEMKVQEKIEKVSEEKEDGREVPVAEKSEESEKQYIPVSTEEVQKMLQYDLFLKEEMVQQGAAYDKENRVRVLSSEINQDEMRGFDTSVKEEQLKDVYKKENFWIDAKMRLKDQEKAEKVEPDMKVVISE